MANRGKGTLVRCHGAAGMEENMERLTEKIDGTDHYRLKSGYGFRMRYSDSKVQKTIDKLAEYEDLEEQGKLLKLPCAVGDMVYKVTKGFGLYKQFVWHIVENKIRNYVQIVRDLDDFGKTVFITKEEAEAALKNYE